MDNLAITHIRYGDGYEYKRVCTYPSPSPIKARIPCQSQGGAVPVGVYIYRERERTEDKTEQCCVSEVG